MNYGRGEVVNNRANEGNINCPGHRDGDARRVVGEPSKRLKTSMEAIQQVADDRVRLTGREDC